MATLSGISQLAMGIISWISFLKVWASYRESGTPTLKYFAFFFAYFGTFQLTMALSLLPRSFTGAQLGAFYIFGHVFLYLSIAYYSRIPTYIWKPEWELKVFAVNLVLGGAITLVNILKWNMPEITGDIVVYHVPQIVGGMIGLLVAVNWIIGGTIFFGILAARRKGTERLKLSLIAVGMLLLSLAGPLHDLTRSVTMLAVADIVTTLGVVTLMAGIYVQNLYQPNRT
ncbi:MAG: hypothetical protein SV186_02200 [Candidatus Nanohaloarchaea archaeon]|nr:hypothetical protein [Candidatus Nanohaloarchaea archaeon]